MKADKYCFHCDKPCENQSEEICRECGRELTVLVTGKYVYEPDK